MDKNLHVTALYLLTHTGLIFFMYPTDIICSLEVGHWIGVLCGFLLHFLIIAVYMKGLSYFPKQDLIGILTKPSKVLGIVLLAPVFAYLFMVVIITLRSYSEMITIVLLANTPLWAVMVLILLISAFLASFGPEALCRTALLLAVLFIPLILFVLFSSFQNADWRYLRPAVDRTSATLSFIGNRSYLQSLFAFAGGFLFLGFIPPYLSYKRNRILWVSLILLPLALLSVYAPILIFGQSTASHFQFPFIIAVDTISIDWFMFDRITMIFMMSTITFVMLFMSLAMWKLSQLLKIGFKRAKTVYIVAALGAIAFVVSLQIKEWQAVENLFWWNTFLRFYVMSVIPIATLILGVRTGRKVVSSHAP